MVEQLALWGAVLTYVVAGSLAIVATVFQLNRTRWILPLLVFGLALHATALGLRWWRLGHGPFVTMFEILSSNLWSLMAAFVVAYWRIPTIRPIAAVVMPLLFVMMGWLLLSHPGESPLPATFRTLWLYVHVGLGKVFLGATLVAVGLSGVILSRRWGWAATLFHDLPDDRRLDALSLRFMALGLVFDSLMLITGAIWAQDAWGRYWAWDPLETWAFLTWLLVALSLHLRLTIRMAPRGFAWMVMAVFVVAFLTFFGVPFISQTPHQGAV